MSEKSSIKQVRSEERGAGGVVSIIWLGGPFRLGRWKGWDEMG